MKIRHTGLDAQHPWPEDIYIQGGKNGLVFSRQENYRTAFVEVFPEDPPTFVRGEGATVAEAEDQAWASYQRLLSCPGHGDWDRRNYRNGAALCGRCGTWYPGVLPPLPADPNAPTPLIEQVLGALLDGRLS